MVHGLARREESKLSDYKRWKLGKSQLIVPAEPQNKNAGNNARMAQKTDTIQSKNKHTV